MFIDVNTMMGLNEYVVKICSATINPKLFPFIIFIGVGAMSFASGCVWSLAAIAFPIVGPVCAAMGINPFLCAGAVISAVLHGLIWLYLETYLLRFLPFCDSFYGYFTYYFCFFRGKVSKTYHAFSST